jgi:hypothetical protein
MGITIVFASCYMWYRKIEHFPLGMKEVRPLLVARGLGGFFGVFGMYCRCLSFLILVFLYKKTTVTFHTPLDSEALQLIYHTRMD